MCVLCFLPIYSGHQVRWTYQPGSHTGFLIHLPSVVRAFIFLAKRIQPFLSLVDREVEFCVLVGHFTGIRTHVPTCQKVTRLLLSYQGDRPASSLDVPAGVTQEEVHTGFLIHLPSAVRVLTFPARRIQPFLSLVDREVEFCVLTI